MNSLNQSPFRHALQIFKDNLDVEELREFELTTLKDLKLQLQAIQNRQESEKKLQNMRRLSYFLEAMEGYGKVIEVFLNTSNILCFVWVRCPAPNTRQYSYPNANSYLV